MAGILSEVRTAGNKPAQETSSLRFLSWPTATRSLLGLFLGRATQGPAGLIRGCCFAEYASVAAQLWNAPRVRKLEMGNKVTYVFKIIPSPIGNLKLVGSDNGLAAILWENDNPQRVRVRTDAEDNRHPVLLEAERQLNEYFEGKRTSFSIGLDPMGTKFQNDVWRELSAIPFGETRSYRQIAQRLGNPRATRAVGAANGRNPIAIVVPCHRVIGSSGKLTGFAGGLEAKAHLLSLEGNSCRP